MTTPKKQIHEVWNSLERNFSSQQSGLDYAKLQDLRDSIFSPGPYYYYIIDFSTRKCSYVHESVTDFFGISTADFSFDLLLNAIHPDDVPFVVQCEKMVHQFLYEEIEPEDITSYKKAYCLRIKNKEEAYKMISHQALTLTTDKNNRIGHVLNIHTDVSHLFSANNKKISFLGLNGKPSYYGIDPYLEKIEKIKSVIMFSKREIEIIKLIADGLSTHQIGEKLFISNDTVKTHRRNILSRSNCNNMSELIAKCVRESII